MLALFHKRYQTAHLSVMETEELNIRKKNVIFMINLPKKTKIEILSEMDYNMGYWLKEFYSNNSQRPSVDFTAMRIITIVECMKIIDYNIPWASSMYDALYPETFANCFS